MDEAASAVYQLIWAYAGPVPPSGRGDLYFLDHHFAWLLLAGTGEIRFANGKRARMRPGEWTLPSPDLTRTQQFSDDAKLLSVRFRFALADGRTPLPIRTFVSFPAADVPSLNASARRLVRLAQGYFDGPLHQGEFQTPDLARRIAIDGAFADWLALMLEALQTHNVVPAELNLLDGRTRAMLECLGKIRILSPVPYGELSRLSALGKVQIDRLFKQHFGASPKRILQRNLLARCQESLAFTTRGVKEIARDHGFRSPPQFCAWFGKHAGLSPQRFRRAVRWQ